MYQIQIITKGIGMYFQAGDIVTFKHEDGMGCLFKNKRFSEAVGVIVEYDSIFTDVKIINIDDRICKEYSIPFHNWALQKLIPIGIDEKGRIKLKKVKE